MLVRGAPVLPVYVVVKGAQTSPFELVGLGGADWGFRLFPPPPLLPPGFLPRAASDAAVVGVTVIGRGPCELPARAVYWGLILDEGGMMDVVRGADILDARGTTDPYAGPCWPGAMEGGVEKEL